MCVGLSLQCKLEPLNEYVSDCVALFLGSNSAGSGQSMLGHLASEDASYLAPTAKRRLPRLCG